MWQQGHIYETINVKIKSRNLLKSDQQFDNDDDNIVCFFMLTKFINPV